MAKKEQTVCRECKEPFYHRVIDNFLPEYVFQQVCSSAEKTELEPKHTDLFRFYQSSDLSRSPKFRGFLSRVRRALDEDLRALNKSVANGEMDLFMSCYQEGCYLLPHDDCLSGRVLAFSFYLNKPAARKEASGERNGRLVLIDTDGITPHSSISPKGNRLVVFEVSPLSYHEVERTQGPRLALTGWLRSPEYCPSSKCLEYVANRYSAFSNELVLAVGVPDRLSMLSGIDLDLDVWRRELAKLEWESRLNTMYCRALEPAASTQIPQFAPTIEGELLDTVVLKIPVGGYVLLNDPFNEVGGSMLFLLVMHKGDVFVLEEKGGSRISLSEGSHIYLCPGNMQVFVPLAETEGYLIAWRMQ